MQQLFLFQTHNKGIPVTDLFKAYYEARKNKRNTINALSFELNYESELFQLHEEINSRNYEIKPSICFINFKPVQREIFAGNFRDRIIHHLIFNHLNPIFERYFINDSYSCRVGKGTSYGIERINKFIRSCSNNYKADCYILKLDIKGYFMAMDRYVLYQKIKSKLDKNNNIIQFDLELIYYLIEKVIFNEPTENCIIKGKKSDWKGLPKSKSLFHSEENKGLPIGNLTSQLFGNVYMNDFDHFVKKKLKIKYYGRYVDDFILIHESKEYLKAVIPVIQEYLTNNLMLELHPNKIYLQHYSKGVKFLGTIIKPYRIYISSRTKNNFYRSIQHWNKIIRDKKKLTKEELELFISSMNSYLGIMKHYNTYNLRKKMLLKELSAYFFNYIYIVNYEKLVPKVRKLRKGEFCTLTLHCQTLKANPLVKTQSPFALKVCQTCPILL